MTTDVRRLSAGLQGSADGLRGIGSAADDMRGGMAGLQTNLTTVSGYLDPLRAFVSGTPDCPNNPICSAVDRVVQPVDDLQHSSDQLASGADKLTAGAGNATDALAGLPQRSTRWPSRSGGPARRPPTCGPRTVVGPPGAPADRLPAARSTRSFRAAPPAVSTCRSGRCQIRGCGLRWTS